MRVREDGVSVGEGMGVGAGLGPDSGEADGGVLDVLALGLWARGVEETNDEGGEVRDDFGPNV